MFYTVYKVTNKINGKFYIGTHKTKDLNDDYMGSEKYLKYAIKKHGIENFYKEILFIYDNPDNMFEKEKERLERAIKERDRYGPAFLSDEWYANLPDSVVYARSGYG